MSPHSAVERSLRQGCPLALHLKTKSDALHDGLAVEVSPFTGAQAGLMLELRRGGLGGTLAFTGLRGRHQRAGQYTGQFMHPSRMGAVLHALQPDAAESEQTQVGRSADGASVTEAAAAAAGIAIDGHSPIPLTHSIPIRHLDVHCCFDGD